MGTVVLLAGYGLVVVMMLVYFVFLFDSATGGLDFTSSRMTGNLVIGIIKRQNLDNGNFYDLGSARGKFAARIAKNLPGLKVYGFDNSGLRIFISKIRSPFVKNVQFKKQDIFTANVSKANVIYLYLPQELMPALEKKLQKELKPGSLVITNRVSFSGRQPTQTLDKLFIYKFA